MKNSLIIGISVLIVAIVEKSQSLKSIDLCIKHKLECDSSDGKLICTESVCDNNLAQKCGPGHCAINKAACDGFKRLNLFLNYFNRDLNYIFDEHIEKFRKFLSLVHHCPKITTVLSDTNVCAKASNCFQKKRMPIRTGDIFFVKQKKCKCPTDFSIECGKSYCTKDENSCELMERSKIRHTELEIKVCQLN